jgi:hypothetical protein
MKTQTPAPELSDVVSVSMKTQLAGSVARNRPSREAAAAETARHGP